VYAASAVTFDGAQEQQEDEEGQEGHEAPELAEKAHRDLHGCRAIAPSTTSSCSARSRCLLPLPWEKRQQAQCIKKAETK